MKKIVLTATILSVSSVFAQQMHHQEQFHTQGKALIEAADKGNYPKVRQLLESSVPANYEFLLCCPLTEAAKKGHVEIVRLLLDHGAAIDYEANWHHYTALLYAAENNHRAVVQLLLEHGANANHIGKDCNSMTALLWSTICADKTGVHSLLQHGADPDQPNKDGTTALVYTITLTKEIGLAIAQNLLRHGANPELKSRHFEATVLQLATGQGNAKLVHTLLERGARPLTENEIEEIHQDRHNNALSKRTIRRYARTAKAGLQEALRQMERRYDMPRNITTLIGQVAGLPEEVSNLTEQSTGCILL